MEGEAERPAQGGEEVPAQGEAERPAQGQADVPPQGEPEAPAEGQADVPERSPGGSRYLVTAAVTAGVLLFALAFFMAGFGARTLLDDDVDLAPIKDELVALNKQADEIQVSLRGDGGDGGQTSPEAAVSAASEDDPTWGPEDASVVIVEFSDFQCPFCERFATETLPRIQETYGDRVRFIYRDFPLSALHPFAQKAAEAAQCAQEQGHFWEYHDLLFAHQDAISDSDLRGYAQEVGANMNRFSDCLDSGKNAQEVLLDAQDGRKAGVSGTPAFLINDLLLSGAQPFAQFQIAIDQALAVAE